MRSAQSRATEDEARRHRAQSERRFDSGSGESSENERRPLRSDGGRERGVSRAERPLSPSEGESSDPGAVASNGERTAASRRARDRERGERLRGQRRQRARSRSPSSDDDDGQSRRGGDARRREYATRIREEASSESVGKRETLLDPNRGSRGHDNLPRSEVRRDVDRSGDSRVHFADPIARHDGRERRKWSEEHPISSNESEVELASTDWRRAAQRRALLSSDRAKRQPTAADHSADASGSSSSDGGPRRRRAGRERAKPASEPKGAAERRREWEILSLHLGPFQFEGSIQFKIYLYLR